MVASGNKHTLVLTAMSLAVGCVWSCGMGQFGHWQLGHGNKVDQPVLMLMVDEGFRGNQIIMVAAGALSVALEAEGRVWTWGHGEYGQLARRLQQ